MSVLIKDIAIAAVVLAVLCICLFKVIKCQPVLMALAVLLAGGTCCLCLWALENGSAYIKPEGDPQETVEVFFHNIEAGNYEEAYALLDNYSTLGLEKVPEGEDAVRIYDLLHSSYSHKFVGQPEVDGLNAVIYVDFTSLNIPPIKELLKDEVNGSLAEAVENTHVSKVYDADKNYLPEFVYGLYDAALDRVLADTSQFMTTKNLRVELCHDGEKWLIKANNDMFTALCGNSVG